MSPSPSSPSGTTIRSRLRLRAIPRTFAVALLVAGATVVGAGPAAARTLGCGEVITVDTRLGDDLLDCPDEGLVIDADDVTLDLNGHTIDGDGISPASCPVEGRACDVGVDNTAGHRGVTIRGGSIQQFAAGVVVTGGDGNHLRRLTITQTTNEAIAVLSSTDPVIEDNTMPDPGITGVVVLDSSDAVVSRNVTSGSTGVRHVPDGRPQRHRAQQAGVRRARLRGRRHRHHRPTQRRLRQAEAGSTSPPTPAGSGSRRTCCTRWATG